MIALDRIHLGTNLTVKIDFYPPGSFSIIDLKNKKDELHVYYPIIYEPITFKDETIFI